MPHNDRKYADNVIGIGQDSLERVRHDPFDILGGLGFFGKKNLALILT